MLKTFDNSIITFTTEQRGVLAGRRNFLAVLSDRRGTNGQLLVFNIVTEEFLLRHLFENVG